MAEGEPMSGSDDADGIAATLGMGIAYRTVGDYDHSVEILSGIAETATEDSVRARAMIEIALTQLEKEEFDAAIEVLDQAAETTREKAPLMSAEAIYAKGLIYEKRLLDFDKAIEAYATISQQKSEYAQLAKKRHHALTSLKSYREAMTDSIPDTPEEVARNLFMMAEILIEDLGLEDDAREHLKSVADSIPQTDFGARAALRFAVLLEAEGDTLARVYQRKVIELFPNTVYANVARAGLGLALVDVVVEKPDSVAADSALVDSTVVEVGPPDSLSLDAQGPERTPPPSSVSPDSAWAKRRGSRSSAPRGSSRSAKQFLKPSPEIPAPEDTSGSREPEPESQDPPETPVPGEGSDPSEPSPADSTGTEDTEGNDQ